MEVDNEILAPSVKSPTFIPKMELRNESGSYGR